MRPRDVLARNLEKLMAATPDLATLPQITEAGGGSNGTLHRIRRKLIATSVDTLAPLAAAYGLQAWELLVPTLTPEQGSDMRPVVKGLPTWPFASISLKRFMDLPEEVRAEVEHALSKEILRRERSNQQTQALHTERQVSQPQAVTNNVGQTKPRVRGKRANPTPAQLATIFPGEEADNGSRRRAKQVSGKGNSRRS